MEEGEQTEEVEDMEGAASLSLKKVAPLQDTRPKESVEAPGIDPGTSRMLSERSTI